MTAGATAATRRRIALRATLIGGAILFLFLVAGRGVLGVLGISVPAFQIAGGLLLLIIAIEMVFDKRNRRKSETAEKAATRGKGIVAAFGALHLPGEQGILRLLEKDGWTIERLEK